MKLKTLSDCMNRIGNKISDALEGTAERILEMHGFDSESGLVRESATISENITGCCIQEKTASVTQAVSNMIEAVNEKVPFTAEELNTESAPLECVYVSVDNIGVNHQKEQRCPGCEETAKYVENTAVHIQYGEEVYVLASSSMKNAMKCKLSFFMIKELFSFRSYTVIPDWFHLKKKCQELLGMALI